ncbi:MAG: DUF1294 domain-containing protein [Pedosphaera sp.]|nr:DUF1294 domain-containing protein [Pedosphaera sp.]
MAPLTGTLVEWNEEKRYGFLEVGRLRIFLHIRDFAERHKRPVIGDKITFIAGQDAQGRTCAKQAVHVNDGGRITAVNLIVLAGLLVLPVLALWRWRVDWRWAGGLGLMMNLFAYKAYAVDKRRAREKEWRLSETKLHLLALLGGWPGAFLAQRRLRHKCSKPKFQIWFWLIVVSYQLAAFDSMQNWKYARGVWGQIQSTAEQLRHSR